MNMDKEVKDTTLEKKDELDLIALVQKFWKQKKRFYRNCGIAAVIGVVVAFSIPKEYETRITLAPESSEANSLSGGVNALASMAGLDMGVSTEDAILPQLYPQVISSLNFLVDLFDTKVKSADGSIDMTLYTYMLKKQKKSWWSYIIAFPIRIKNMILSKKHAKRAPEEKIDPFYLTQTEADMAAAIAAKINCSVDRKTSVISLTIRMQDPLISASMADAVRIKLQDYVANYRTEKSRKDLEYVEGLYKEAEKEYVVAQRAYSTYVDGNLNIVKARFKSEEQRLENEYQMAYSAYSQVAKQLQMAKAKVQERIPVYTIIQPATVPLKPAKPKKSLVLIGFVFLGIFFTIGSVLVQDMREKYKQAA